MTERGTGLRDRSAVIELRAREKLDFLINWLVDQGFGVDWTSTQSLPVWLRDELAVRWSAADNCSVGDADWMLRQEGQVWDDDAPTAFVDKQHGEKT